jgi:hypothetical protein
LVPWVPLLVQALTISSSAQLSSPPRLNRALGISGTLPMSRIDWKVLMSQPLAEQ